MHSNHQSTNATVKELLILSENRPKVANNLVQDRLELCSQTIPLIDLLDLSCIQANALCNLGKFEDALGICHFVSTTIGDLSEESTAILDIRLIYAKILAKNGYLEESLAVIQEMRNGFSEIEGVIVESNFALLLYSLGDAVAATKILYKCIEKCPTESSLRAKLWLNVEAIRISSGSKISSGPKVKDILAGLNTKQQSLYWFNTALQKEPDSRERVTRLNRSLKLARNNDDMYAIGRALAARGYYYLEKGRLKIALEEFSWILKNTLPDTMQFHAKVGKLRIAFMQGNDSCLAEKIEKLDCPKNLKNGSRVHLDYLKLLRDVREAEEDYKGAFEVQKVISEVEKERFSGAHLGELHELRRKYDMKVVKKESFKLKHRYNKMMMMYVRQQSMISSVAHDLKGPLSGISNLAYYTSEMTEQHHTEKRNKYLNLISDTTKHLSDSVENLLGMRAMETGSVSVSPKFIECGELLPYATEVYGVMASKKNITLTCEGSLENCLIFADKSPLLEAVGNLVSNAIRYTQEGGNVAIVSSCDFESETATISVVDNGPGIPEGIRESMYKKFARMNGDHDSSKISLGLGLWIVSEICKNMKATLTCESEIGVGTTFSITMATQPVEELVE